MATTFTLISSVTVGSGGASSIDFTSIPATYTDLLVKVCARSSYAGVNGTLYIALNSIAGTSRVLYGNGSSAVSASYSGIYGRDLSAATATANTFGSAEVYIPNYTNSTNKSLSVDTVGETNATTTLMSLAAGLWSNTAAITSVNLTTDGNFVQYSTAYLYGIKSS